VTAPLAGVRVLDFSRVLSGPFATMCLADLGADVVKVEAPGDGDDTRGFGSNVPRRHQHLLPRRQSGKRSIALDLKSERDRATARELARVTDVVIENFRPGVMARLGLDAASLRAIQPRLVYCSISGFGQGDDRGGYDLVIQGMSGIPSLTGEPGGAPMKNGASVADLVAGHNAVQAILSALYRRERTGEERRSISRCSRDGGAPVYHATGWLNAGAEPRRWGNQHPSIHPYGTYEAADGWLNPRDRHRSRSGASSSACLLGWQPDPRFAKNVDRVGNREPTRARAWMRSRTIEAWGGHSRTRAFLGARSARSRRSRTFPGHPRSPDRRPPGAHDAVPYQIDGAPTARLAAPPTSASTRKKFSATGSAPDSSSRIVVVLVVAIVRGTLRC
jgi:formyl-CoA transferase